MRKHLLCVALVCVIPTFVICESCSTVQESPVAQGTVSMPLEASAADGTLYRLHAIFSISGDDSQEVNSDDYSGDSAEVTLEPGSYLVTLQNGWEVELAETSEVIEAELTSASEVAFTVTEDTATTITFTFLIEGEEPVTTGDGCAVIAVAFNEGSTCIGQPDFSLCDVVTVPDFGYDICVNEQCISPGTCGDASCNTPGPSFTLADTGQTTCYGDETELSACQGTPGSDTCGSTNYCGQDAQIGWDAAHSIDTRFTRSSGPESRVADAVTGLEWTGCPAGARGTDCTVGSPTPMDFADALLYCDSITWDGDSDWRLPDRYELQSLANYSRTVDDNPIATAFPLMESYFWTSTSVVDTVAIHVLLAADHGGAVEVQAADKTAELQVFCVRGAPQQRPNPRFVRTSDWQSTIADRHADLVWQGCRAGEFGENCDTGAPAAYTWAAALAYCETLDWGGRNDWRLPNAIELGTFSWYDQPDVAPGLDATSDSIFWFLDAATWTSTTYPIDPTSAWYSNGLRVLIDYGRKDGAGNAQYVRCVADAS